MPLVCVKGRMEDAALLGNAIIETLMVSVDIDETPAMTEEQIVDEHLEDIELGFTSVQRTADEKVLDTGAQQTTVNEGQRGFGKANAYWSSNAVGDVLVFREDFSPVTVEVVETFTAFCKEFDGGIRSVLEEYADESEEDMRWAKERHLEYAATNEAWERFVPAWRSDKLWVLNRIAGHTGWLASDVAWIAGFTGFKNGFPVKERKKRADDEKVML